MTCTSLSEVTCTSYDFAYNLFCCRIPLGPTDNQLSLVAYSTDTVVYMKLGERTDLAEIYEIIDTIPFKNQRTNITGALRTIRQEIFVHGYDRPDSKNVVLVLTDGADNVENGHGLLATEAKLLKKTGAHVFAVGVGKHGITIMSI